LKTARYRGSDPGLRFGVAQALNEEIRSPTETLGRGKRDRIDPVLDGDKAGGRNTGDPMRKRFDVATTTA
jgi:hypothetical protein